MSTIDHNLLDAWQASLDQQKIESTERHLVDRHDGDFVRVPESVAAGLLGYLLSSIECDIDDLCDGEIDQETHTQYVYAMQLQNAVHDDWNGRHD